MPVPLLRVSAVEAIANARICSLLLPSAPFCSLLLPAQSLYDLPQKESHPSHGARGFKSKARCRAPGQPQVGSGS